LRIADRFLPRRKIFRKIASASGPLRRTIPIPPSPTGVEIAAIVSSRLYMFS